MNIALVFDDRNRYWTVGSYVKRELSRQDDICIVAHPRIPEDTGILEEQCGLDINLILVIDSSTHYKIHHHRGKLSKNTRSAVWLSDLHRPDWAVWRLQMIKDWRYDHVFYAQKNFKEIIMSCGYNENEITWLPHAVDPDIFKSMSYITKRYDIGYVGYKNEKRQQIQDILKEYMNFKHFDSVWELNAARCINELKVCLNVTVENDILNMRTFETMACGVPLLINKTENNGMEDFFTEGQDFLWYENSSELKEKSIRLLANPDLRSYLANNAMQKALAFHTYRNRINTILGTMGFDLLKNYE